jgi:hypothetical protein
MKSVRLATIVLLLLITLTSCASETTDLDCDKNEDGNIGETEQKRCDAMSNKETQEDKTIETTTNEFEIEVSSTQNYTMFSLNVHDWVFPEDSIETVHRVIDIHEKYQIPIDIYLTGPTLHNYEDLDPTLVERLQTSEVVFISSHFRPPYPVYDGFDYIELAEMIFMNMLTGMTNSN